jgi:tetratricopeptide (TPR) repeat protein
MYPDVQAYHTLMDRIGQPWTASKIGGVTAIRRGPAPPGPVADLFSRLDELHMAAGLPSMREIASRAGRGRISSSTVHNVFRGTKVPRWNSLEDIVRALGGDGAEFLGLWRAAWQAENSAELEPDKPFDDTPSNPGLGEAGFALPKRIWSSEIPHRNRNFTGRVTELERLRANLIKGGQSRPRAQIISGIGGIGKTELATEYIHQHRDEYEIIWWIRAEHHDRVRDALVKLGQRLEFRQARPGGERDRTIAAVLEALESEVRPNWLLVYDNAARPLDLQRYLPACPPGGHVIITSQVESWPGYTEADGIEVAPFSEDEAIRFLRNRVSALRPDLGKADGSVNERQAAEARRLASVLERLPIALEHAAAYLTETRDSVDNYLARFEANAHQLFSGQAADLPVSVSGAWKLSTSLLAPDAEHLFNLCAFFSPEPIANVLPLKNAEAVIEPPGLRGILSSSTRFRAAASQLNRLSLVKVDGARDQIQMHRAVQAVTRGQLRENAPDVFEAYQTAVGNILAASNPRNPDRGSNDATYDLSLHHLESERSFLDMDNQDLRRLIIDQVRRLHLRGAHVEAVRFGQDALKEWKDRYDEFDLLTLTLTIEVAIAMRIDGRVADGRQHILDARRRLTERYGDEHEVSLLCSNAYGADLRSRGQFPEALELDLGLRPKFERVFGPDNERTLNVRNNLAADFRRLGRFHEALRADQETYLDRRRILGADDTRTLTSRDAVALDLRRIGRYEESLEIARKVVEAFNRAAARENPDSLNSRKGFAAALRKAGYPWDALQESEDVVQRFQDYLGPDSPDTLRAAINLVNDRRSAGELMRAEELGREVHDRCQGAGFSFDYTYAALSSLASVLREAGRIEEARRYDVQAREGLIETYGELHPFTLAAGINYVSDLAAVGDLAEAIRVGQEILRHSRGVLGENHPDTLVAEANLAADLAASGALKEADSLWGDVLSRYEQTLTLEHPDARAAAQQVRLTAEIEPF